jgi:hypothetical protein
VADDLSQLAADLSAAPREAWPLIGKALGVTALKVKKDWAENLGGTNNRGSAFKRVGAAVDYDVRVLGVGTGLEAEIGPNLARPQGSFAGWFEEGQANIPALHAGYSAMKANEGDFEQGLAIAVEQALKKVGL